MDNQWMKPDVLLKNKWVRIAVIVVVVLFVLGIIKNQVIKTAVKVGASTVLGTPVEVSGLAVGVFKPSVQIRGFKVYNPKGFPKGALLDVSQVRVDYDLPAILGGKLHFPLIILDLKEMVVIKNAEGVLNVDALKVAQKEEAPSKPQEKKKEPAKEMPMQIDVLRLNVGNVVYKDYSQGKEPVVQAFDVNLKDKEYKNITSAQQIAALVLTESMKPTAIQGAKVYGAATLLGVGFLPAGIAGTLLGKDSGQKEFNVGYSRAFKTALAVVEKAGTVLSTDEAGGVIKAKVSGCDVTVRVTKKDGGKTEIIVSARKFMIPKPEIAQGVLYQIEQKL